MVGEDTHVTGRGRNIDLNDVRRREDSLADENIVVSLGGQACTPLGTNLVGEDQRELDLVGDGLGVATTTSSKGPGCAAGHRVEEAEGRHRDIL